MKCKIENCENNISNLTLKVCQAHYLRFRRHGSFDLTKTKREKLVEEGKSYCPKCDKEKDIEEFNKDKHTGFGVSIYCKSCVKEKSANRYKNHKRAHKNTQLKNSFGITIDDYESILSGQKGQCCICKVEPEKSKMLSVDHCHKTGRVRGLLCSKCNCGLGQFNDDAKLLEKAIEYLRKSHE